MTRGPRSAAPACGLTSLGDPRLGGVLPGLTEREGYFEIDKAAFPCCGGSGSRLMPDANVTLSCSLTARLKLVRSLSYQARRQGSGGAARRDITPVVLKRLSAIAAGESRRGLALLLSAETAGNAGGLWPVAFAAAWRFGLTPHLVTLGRGPVQDLLPAVTTGTRPLLLVEGVSALWDAAQSDALDVLAGYAYRALVPMFLELTLTTPPARAGGVGARSSRQAFSSRLAGIKSRSPLSWLAPECAAKLPAVVEGLERLQPPSRPVASPPKSGPPLPWE